jgi:hypothetical protein
MHRYAVTWSQDGLLESGRLETYRDRLELHGRSSATVIPFTAVADAAIERGPADRLHGLAVLTLRLGDGGTVRIASLEGPGVLHELCALVEQRALMAAS